MSFVKFRLVSHVPSTSSSSSSREIVVNITDECCRQDEGEFSRCRQDEEEFSNKLTNEQIRDKAFRDIEKQTLRFDRASVVKDFFYPQLENPFAEPRLFMAPIPEINMHYIPSLSIAL